MRSSGSNQHNLDRGLNEFHAALARLASDADLLDKERQRFSRPPKVPVSRDETPIMWYPPKTASAKERGRRQEELRKLHATIEHSIPVVQFQWQVAEELERMVNSAIRYTPSEGCSLSDDAYNNVKQRWLQQGIWDEAYALSIMARWKHESDQRTVMRSSSLPQTTHADNRGADELLSKDNSSSRVDSLAPEVNSEILSVLTQTPSESAREESSRPIFQFLYQLKRETEAICDISSHEHRIEGLSSELGQRIYLKVRANWVKQGIWDSRWGILPGMRWLHEEPREFVDSWFESGRPSLVEQHVLTPNTKRIHNLMHQPASESYPSCSDERPSGDHPRTRSNSACSVRTYRSMDLRNGLTPRPLLMPHTNLHAVSGSKPDVDATNANSYSKPQPPSQRSIVASTIETDASQEEEATSSTTCQTPSVHDNQNSESVVNRSEVDKDLAESSFGLGYETAAQVLKTSTEDAKLRPLAPSQPSSHWNPWRAVRKWIRSRQKGTFTKRMLN